MKGAWQVINVQGLQFAGTASGDDPCKGLGGKTIPVELYRMNRDLALVDRVTCFANWLAGTKIPCSIPFQLTQRGK